MINIEFRRFFSERIWFGWWYRGLHEGILAGDIFGWVRDPSTKYHWTVILREQYDYN